MTDLKAAKRPPADHPSLASPGGMIPTAAARKDSVRCADFRDELSPHMLREDVPPVPVACGPPAPRLIPALRCVYRARRPTFEEYCRPMYGLGVADKGSTVHPAFTPPSAAIL